jgi:hypothetical protein
VEDITLTLPSIPIYDDYSGFLTRVANWVEVRMSSLGSARHGLACEVVREAQDVWCGVGVYTVSELFFDAGKVLYCFLSIKAVN